MDANRRNLIVKMREIADALEAGIVDCAALVYTTAEGGVEYRYQGETLSSICLTLHGLRQVPALIEDGLAAAQKATVVGGAGGTVCTCVTPAGSPHASTCPAYRPARGASSEGGGASGGVGAGGWGARYVDTSIAGWPDKLGGGGGSGGGSARG